MTYLSDGDALCQRRFGVVNRIIGDWQMTGVFSAATGNYYTATDVVSVSNADCGGTVGFQCARPNLVGIPTPSRAFRERCLIPVRF